MTVSRPLTAGEIRLAQSVFGNSIDYAAVKIHDGAYIAFQPQNSGMTPNGQIYMRDCYEDDYSKQSAGTRAFFLHEMTHVWQYQNKVLNPIAAAARLNLKHKFNYAASYFYFLDKKKDLTQYGMEQQAAIIEGYYLHKNGEGSRHCKNLEEGWFEKQALYEKVLGKFLKNPAYARKDKFPLF